MTNTEIKYQGTNVPIYTLNKFSTSVLLAYQFLVFSEMNSYISSTVIVLFYSAKAAPCHSKLQRRKDYRNVRSCVPATVCKTCPPWVDIGDLYSGPNILYGPHLSLDRRNPS
jgi:hypothetical protein